MEGGASLADGLQQVLDRVEAEEVSTRERRGYPLRTFCILMRTRGTEHMRVGCSRLMSPYTQHLHLTNTH